ncbi:sel1 repeat family protein, partial [Tessaracoccus sp. OH4464_COT-324]|uniref:sel1 repeat family protein n=1 Tax=Tessaracoccus sp. OH4464_COT-324 TaxID=2491059 RepID=UPI0018F7B379
RTGSGYRISDYLLDRDELPTTTTDSLWEAAFELATPEEVFAVKAAANEAGRPEYAESLWRAAAEQGHTNAMTTLDRLLKGQGRTADPETWLHRAAELGNEEAARWLAELNPPGTDQPDEG